MLFDKIKEKKSIRMQYPYDSTGTNPFFDGRMHEIIPSELMPIKLNGREFYVMRYYDVSMNASAITLLTRIGNTFVKVPLDNYDILFDYLEKNPISNNENSQITLPSTIQLAQTMNAEELFMPSSSIIASAGGNPPNRPPVSFDDGNPPNRPPVSFDDGNPPNRPPVSFDAANPPNDPNKPSLESLNNLSTSIPVFKFEEYVTYVKTPDESFGIIGGSYSFDNVIGYSLSDKSYMFNKTPSFDAKNIILQRIVNSLPTDNQMRRYKITVNVPYGTIGEFFSLDDEGNEKTQKFLLSPGIYEYKIRFVPCKYREDFISSKYADKIFVETHLPEHVKSFDDKDAFYYGCRRDVHTQMVFYNANLQRIDNEAQKHSRR